MLRIDENNVMYIRNVDIPKSAICKFVVGGNVVKIDMNPYNIIKGKNHKEDLFNYVNTNINAMFGAFLTNTFDLNNMSSDASFSNIDKELELIGENIASLIDFELDFYNKFYHEVCISMVKIIGLRDSHLSTLRYNNRNNSVEIPKSYDFFNLRTIIKLFMNFFMFYTDGYIRDYILASLISDSSSIGGNGPILKVTTWDNFTKDYVPLGMYSTSHYRYLYNDSFITNFSLDCGDIENAKSKNMTTEFHDSWSAAYNEQMPVFMLNPRENLHDKYASYYRTLYSFGRPITVKVHDKILNGKAISSIAGYQLINSKNKKMTIGVSLKFIAPEYENIIVDCDNCSYSTYIKESIDEKCSDTAYSNIKNRHDLEYCIDNFDIELDVCYFSKQTTSIPYKDLKDRKMPIDRRDAVMRILCQVCYSNNIHPKKLLSKIDCKFIRQYKEKDYFSFVV